jgi:hypothetical protein
VGGQEDLIEEVALDIKAAADPRLLQTATERMSRN